MALSSVTLAGVSGAMVGSGEALASGGEAVLSAASPVTLALEPTTGAAVATSGTCPRRLKIEIGEPRIAPGERVAVHVFVGEPEASAQTPLDDPSYLGSFTFFTQAGTEGGQRYMLTLDRLGPSERERLCSADPPSVTLVLVPIAEGAVLQKSEVEIRTVTLE